MRRPVVAGIGGLHSVWAFQHRGITVWGPADPGMSAREAEQMALERLTSSARRRVRRVRARWQHPLPVLHISDRAASAALAHRVSARDTYKAWRRSGFRLACDASFDPARKRGAWGYTHAGSDEVSVVLGDANNSMLCELRAATAALRATPPGASVELLIDYRPLAETVADLGRAIAVPVWPSVTSCQETSELFAELCGLIDERRVSATWVPGHCGHTLFKKVDQATRAAMRKERRALLAE